MYYTYTKKELEEFKNTLCISFEYGQVFKVADHKPIQTSVILYKKNTDTSNILSLFKNKNNLKKIDTLFTFNKANVDNALILFNMTAVSKTAKDFKKRYYFACKTMLDQLIRQAQIENRTELVINTNNIILQELFLINKFKLIKHKSFFTARKNI